MDNMKSLYEKVSSDNGLQQEFAGILREAEEAGREATEAKLQDFARRAGFSITIEEMNRFFLEKSQKATGELSEAELDMVAGGKTVGEGIYDVIFSVMTVIVGCIAAASTGVPGERCG